MRKYIVILSISVFCLLLADLPYKLNHNVYGIIDELYVLDKEKSKIKDYYKDNLYLYDRPEIVGRWFRITDNYLLNMFNEDNLIKQNNDKLVFGYSDGTFIKMDRDRGSFKDNMPFYLIEFSIGYTDKIEDYLEDISTFQIMVKPVPINGKTYFFVVMKRIFNHRGGVQYGTFRILTKSEDKYEILAKQEDILPPIKEVNDLLKQNRHDSQKMAWVPYLMFLDHKMENDILYFSLPYGFYIPNCANCPRNSVMVRYSFDGKVLKPLKASLQPWEEYDNQGKVHTNQGKDYTFK